jgi:hypothetical protein
MNIWHKRFLYLQIVLMLTLLVSTFFPFPEQYVFVLSFLFLFFEVVIYGAKAKENPQAVFYKPSCVVALLDLLSKALFVFVGWLKIISVIRNDFFWINPVILSLLFLYIAIRKFYIIKNYSYEK